VVRIHSGVPHSKRLNRPSLYFFPSNFGYADRFRCGIGATFAGPNSSLSGFSTRAFLLGRDCFQVVPLRGFHAGVPELALGVFHRSAQFTPPTQFREWMTAGIRPGEQHDIDT
jgi:hypothetical protein